MNRKIVCTLLLLITTLYINAQSISISDFYQIQKLEPWVSQNSVSFLSDVSQTPTQFLLDYSHVSSDTSLTFEGNKQSVFNINTKSFQRINQTTLLGRFEYENQKIQRSNFNNTDRYLMAYPYLLLDTVGGDEYSRERFKFCGALSLPLFQKIHHGIAIQYEASVAVQDRDPRPENKVVVFDVTYGAHLKLKNGFKPSMHLHYKYYNEDIDVDIIEKNKYHTLYYHHGLGASSDHNAGSFYRLYKQNLGGASIQLKYNDVNFTSYTNAKFEKGKLTIDDGRKSGNASWASIKNDSELQKNYLSIYQFFVFSEKHKISVEYLLNKHVGTEFIQKLESVNETDLEHWVTYACEEKYLSKQSQTHFEYTWFKLDPTQKLNRAFGLDATYSKEDESYTHPAYYINTQHIEVGVSALQKISFNKQVLMVSANVHSFISLSTDHLLNQQSEIVKRVIEPNMHIANENRWTTHIGFSYQFRIKKMEYVSKLNFTNTYRESKQQTNQMVASFGILL